MSKPVLKPRLKLWVEREEGAVLGDFRVDLLRAIRDTGSLVAASERLGVSYRRAWGMIRAMERNLGASLVLTTKGGSDRGGSHLTEQAEALIAQYDRFRKRMEVALAKEFRETFVP